MRDDLIAQVEQAVHRHDLLREGDRVLVAVSGGLDSVVLLDLLVRLSSRRKWALQVAHFDHGIRAESVEDARWVSARARELGLECVVGRADSVRSGSDRSPEQFLRGLRLDFLERAAATWGAEKIALGHHRDDRVEWLLMRLFDGVPPDGWSLAVENGPLVRPLHALSREQLRAYARARSLSWREDPSNRDASVPRNRIRHRVLPQLEAELGPSLAEALAHVADAAERDRRYFEEPVRELARRARGAGGLSAQVLIAAPAALRDRVLGAWLIELGLEPRRVYVEALAGLLGAREGKGLDLASGLRLVLRAGYLVKLEAREITGFVVASPDEMLGSNASQPCVERFRE